MALIDTTRILPTFYYKDHACSLLDVVTHLYAPILQADEHDYIMRLRKLPSNALCLYLRLVNRKPTAFALSSLQYEEISHLEEAAITLHAHGFALWNAQQDRLTIKERHHWRWLLFLYFGQPEENLSRFSVFDLRVNKAEPYSLESLQPHFLTRDAALCALQAHQLYNEYRKQRDKEKRSILSIAIWFLSLENDMNYADQDIYQQLLFSLGRRLERAGHKTHAFMVYKNSNRADSLERKTRLLMQWKMRHDACDTASILLQCDNITQKQQNYAQRILTSRKQKNALMQKHITLDFQPYMPVEREVLDVFEQHGWRGEHCENNLWRQLHALLLWDIIHDAMEGGINHPMQLGTNHMRCNHTFKRTRLKAIEGRLSTISSQHILINVVKDAYERYGGTPNRFCSWTQHADVTLTALCSMVPYDALLHIVKIMSHYVATHRCGFPDLFIWRDNEYQLLEVKSPNDTISDIQQFWHEEFIRLNLPIHVCHVSW